MAQSRLELRELYIIQTSCQTFMDSSLSSHEINIGFAYMKQTTIYVR